MDVRAMDLIAPSKHQVVLGDLRDCVNGANKGQMDGGHENTFMIGYYLQVIPSGISDMDKLEFRRVFELIKAHIATQAKTPLFDNLTYHVRLQYGGLA